MFISWWLWILILYQGDVHCIPPEDGYFASKQRVGLVHTEAATTRELHIFNDYTDIQLFQFTIPRQTSEATFTLTTETSSDCDRRNISVYLQVGGFPVVSPVGAAFDPSMWINRKTLYSQSFWTDDAKPRIYIQNPLEGNWFMIGCITENSDEVIQIKEPECKTWLEVKVIYEVLSNVTMLSTITEPQNQIISMFSFKKMKYFSFFVPSMVWSAKIVLESCSLPFSRNNPIFALYRPMGLPMKNSTDTLSFQCDFNINSTCVESFIPMEETWHYLLLSTLYENHMQCASVSIILQGCNDVYKQEIVPSVYNNNNYIPAYSKDEEPSFSGRSFDEEPNDSLTFGSCIHRSELDKIRYEEEFLFDLTTNDKQTNLNISGLIPTIFTFSVQDAIDTGGSLNIEIDVSSTAKGNTHNDTDLIRGCISFLRRDELHIQSDGSISCRWGRNIGSKVLIPYPESGIWFITLYPLCPLNISSVHTCPDNISMVLKASSDSCVEGGCGRYGSCFLASSSGFIYSSCVCKADYKGWNCNDDSSAKEDWELLMAALLLILSNIFFVPPAILAFHRKFYTECLLYASAFFFSTFYHACDQEINYYCIMPYNVLQFADYFCAVLSFSSTLITVAHLPRNLFPVFHMAGAVIVAVGVTYDRFSTIVLAIPCLYASLVMVSSWVYNSKKTARCFPPKRYWIWHIVPSSVMGITGLMCFTFLETKDNYYIVHSVWHTCMALSMVFVLPPKREEKSWKSDVFLINGFSLTNVNKTQNEEYLASCCE